MVAQARAYRRCRPGAWLLALALPLGINEALLKPLFPETHNLVSDWYIFNHYLLLTIYGFVLASMPGAWDWLAQSAQGTADRAGCHLVGTLGLLEGGIVARDTAGDCAAGQCRSPGAGSWCSWGSAAST